MLSDDESGFYETYEHALRIALLQQNIAREVYKAGQETYKEKFVTTETPLPAPFRESLCEALEKGINIPTTPTTHPLEPSQVATRCCATLATTLRNQGSAENITLEELLQLYVDHVLFDFRNNGLSPSLQVKTRLVKCLDEFLLVTLPLAKGNTDLMNRLGSYKLVLLHLEQDQYVEFVGELFNQDSTAHQENIRLLRPYCTRQAAILELQSHQAKLEEGDTLYKEEDFQSPTEFQKWMSSEKEKIKQLLNGLQSIPCVMSEQEEKVSLIPKDAKKHLKNLLLLMPPEEQYSKSTSEIGSIFLNLCTHHWRVPAFYRKAAHLEAATIKWDMDELPYEYLGEAIAEVDSLSEDAILPDIRALLSVCESLEVLLIKRFGEALRLLDRNPQEEFGWIKVIVNNIKDNPILLSHREGNGPFVQQIEECIQYSALERYKELQARVFSDDQEFNEAQNLLEITRIMLDDIAKCRTMFPFDEFKWVGLVWLCRRSSDPLFCRTPSSPGINVIATLIKPQLGYFTLDIQNMIDDPNSKHIALRDTFELYSNVSRLSDIAKLHGSHFQFDLTKWFQSQINRWLADLDAKALDWVKRAIDKDQFGFVSDKLRHSSSIVDLFSFFQQQVNPGFELHWPSSQMKASFVRDLSKIVMKRLQLYCQIIREKFHEQMERQRDEIAQKAESASKYGWTSLLRKEKANPPDENEFEIPNEYCVMLNNLAQAESSLFKLWTALEYEPEPEDSGSENTLDTQTTLTYLVTVVQAQNLPACNFNGSSDSFVELNVGSRGVGQTTVIEESLHPWWEESFQFEAHGSQKLHVAVYAKNYMQDDEICGLGLPLVLEAQTYAQYTIQEDWIPLVPHGRALIRSVALGETEHVEYYFGKSLNIVTVTLNDMARLLVYQMQQDLSTHIHGMFHSIRGKSTTAITTELCDKALHRLLNYLDRSLGTLYENLYDKSWKAVVGEIWSSIIDIYESILFPPLGTSRSPLSETELQVTYKCLELTKVFFNGGSTESGVHIQELENQRYQQLMLTQRLFLMSTEELIDSFRAHVNQVHTEDHDGPEQSILMTIYYILRVLQMVHKAFNERFVRKQMEMIAFPTTD
ncbi:hypothetical protein K493DRAFT_410742 [Basidiobolus meristosporus CBS 931.73]|uniref:C2 domain-containing protein n=1 Tax=Basidiobolus meristosporus CBS 931.73 TaxID=1314790 RepID=A0A1Y1XUG4_9FUNG|nr:hypothetical protein K493DRAFT_410742 [Basidiobolus meristosporus CBS 931.73]|eukprot:ORX88924.1 hypothetical protein K493DRAFT_410742 [Basidiobolus meristosporus CBS 931.73]